MSVTNLDVGAGTERIPRRMADPGAGTARTSRGSDVEAIAAATVLDMQTPMTSGHQGATVAMLVRALGKRRIAEMPVPPNPGLKLGRPVIIDPMSGPPVDFRDGSIVLAVGVCTQSRELAEIVEAAAENGCSAVLCKVDSEFGASTVQVLSEQHNICVLGMRKELSWDETYTVVASLLSLTGAKHSRDLHSLNAGLFALADAAATILNAPVIINDANFEVIAYSGVYDGFENLDEVRQDSILAMRPPSDALEGIQKVGIPERVRASDDPLIVEFPGGTPRLATSINAGGEHIGYIWVQPGPSEFDQNSIETLRDLRKHAAHQILQAQLSEQLEWRRRDVTFQGVLAGRIPARNLEEFVAFDPVRPGRLIGFRIGVDDGSESVARSAIQSMIEFKLASDNRRGVTAVHEDGVYALLEGSSQSELQSDREWINRLGVQIKQRFSAIVKVAIGSEIYSYHEIESAYAVVESIFTFSESLDNPIIATFDEYRSRLLLSKLTGLFATNTRWADHRITRLAEIDAERGTDYIHTLHTYLECSCDLGVAARKLYVHRNTLKYRLGRIREICPIDLSDSTERLAAELQVRYLIEKTNSAARIPAKKDDIQGTQLDG